MLTISFLQQFRAKSFFLQFLVDFFTLGSRNRGSANVSSLYPEPYFLSPCIRIRTYHLPVSGSIFFTPIYPDPYLITSLYPDPYFLSSLDLECSQKIGHIFTVGQIKLYLKHRSVNDFVINNQ